MLKQLQNVFRTVFQDENLVISEKTTANDIKMWDSLMHLELIATIESEFNIVFSFNEVMGLNNVGDLLHLIQTKKK
jgi:acyl carrier protein